MKPSTVRVAALSAGISLLITTGCQNLTPGENAAVFGGMAGIAAGRIASAAGMSGAESFATGAAVGAVTAAVVYVVAKHQATERQRKIAEQRARAAYARMERQRQAEVKKGKKIAKKPRYIAVETERSEQAPKQAKKSVMIWDTESQQIVGNNVYDVESTPRVGSTARFETYSAQYVGTGS